MDTSTLKTFVTLAKMGHMTRASKVLHLTQPAVSAQLSKLEAHVGHQLFDRTPKGMMLTQAGQVYLEHVESSLKILEDGHVALDELAGLVRGQLAVGGGATATTYLLPSLLGQFHTSFPGVHMFVREQGSQHIVDAVARGELDLGIVTLSSNFTDKRVNVEPWIDDEMVLIVPDAHPLAGKTHFEWRDLHDQALVLFEASSTVRRLIDQRLNEQGIKTRSVMELRSIESIKQMVAQGIGAAFVSRLALESTQNFLRAAKHPLGRQLAIVWRRNRQMSQATISFLDLMRAQGLNRRPCGLIRSVWTHQGEHL